MYPLIKNMGKEQAGFHTVRHIFTHKTDMVNTALKGFFQHPMNVKIIQNTLIDAITNITFFDNHLITRLSVV